MGVCNDSELVANTDAIEITAALLVLVVIAAVWVNVDDAGAFSARTVAVAVIGVEVLPAVLL